MSHWSSEVASDLLTDLLKNWFSRGVHHLIKISHIEQVERCDNGKGYAHPIGESHREALFLEWERGWDETVGKWHTHESESHQQYQEKAQWNYSKMILSRYLEYSTRFHVDDAMTRESQWNNL